MGLDTGVDKYQTSLVNFRQDVCRHHNLLNVVLVQRRIFAPTSFSSLQQMHTVGHSVNLCVTSVYFYHRTKKSEHHSATVLSS